MRASVIIPTKNPGPAFARVLDAVCSQETEWPYEVIVIDSGSSDGTVEMARARDGVAVIQIPPAEYGHGRTRNLAISKARGEFCALITHDALPVGRNWLREIVAALEADPAIAGAFGPHLAYPEHSVFTKRDLEQHFDSFANMPLVVSRDLDPERYANDLGWRQLLHFYSDNNSCLRRKAWDQIPYPDVDFAEDQIWALKVIEAGWKKAFAPNAAVFHSHEYGVFDHLRRAFDESHAFFRLFGYRLGGGFREAFKSACALAQADWRWGRAHDVPTGHIVRRMAVNAATVIGHSLGSRGTWLPERIKIFLSRDKKLFYSTEHSQPVS